MLGGLWSRLAPIGQTCEKSGRAFIRTHQQLCLCLSDPAQWTRGLLLSDKILLCGMSADITRRECTKRYDLQIPRANIIKGALDQA